MNLKFCKNIWIFIVSLLCIIFFFSFINSKKTFEGFDSQYKYLAPIPPGTTWTQKSQDDYTAKIKDTASNFPLSDAMKYATEEEARQFIYNGLWPYDDYVIGLYKKAVELKIFIPMMSGTLTGSVIDMQKKFPNRLIYTWIAMGLKIVPNLNVYNQLMPLHPSGDGTTSGGGYSIGDNQNIVCDTTGHLKIKNLSDRTYTDTSDYTLFEKIPGLKFISEPCNLCDINSACSITLDGKSAPESYNIYTGSSTTYSKPSLITPDTR